MTIEQAAVLGAGVMGAQIAAHFANAGVPVHAARRGAGRRGEPQRARRGRGPEDVEDSNRPRSSRSVPRGLVTPAAIWKTIWSAWLEKPTGSSRRWSRIWRSSAGFTRRSKRCARKAQSSSSNTSTIPLEKLVESLPERFAKDFLITHFFNPPRYMRLLEVVAGAATRAEAVAPPSATLPTGAWARAWSTATTRPGFIANRIGIFWMQCGVVAAQDHGVTVEEADAVMSRPVGIPKTGVFGLLDLVGLDLHAQGGCQHGGAAGRRRRLSRLAASTGRCSRR